MKVVYDIETLAGTFTYTALDIRTEELYQYVIHPNLNQLDDLMNHLNKCTGQIGFNNVSFDYPIIHFIMINYEDWKWQLDSGMEAKDIIDDIYAKAQSIISEQNNSRFGGGFGIKSKDVKIPQLDLFRIYHYNNAARSTSLKSLQIAMNYHNVQDMDIPHTTKKISESMLKDILAYNANDVYSTYEFFKLSKGKIELRKGLMAKYKLPCINYPDSKIGESLMLKLYCDKTGLDPREVRQLRTKRDSIALKDCIFDYVKFKTKTFSDFLHELKTKVVTETKGSLSKSIIFEGLKYDFGLGGLHSAAKPGVYKSSDTHVIITCDIASMYPTTGIKNNLYPAHLGLEFCNVYEDLLMQRIAAKKAGNMILSDGYKLSLNSCYGKSNDEHSFLFDSFYTLSVTVNGQLLMAMLCERLAMNGIEIIMINTK